MKNVVRKQESTIYTVLLQR